MIRAVDPGVAISLVANGVDLTAFSPAQIPEAGTLRLICVARLIERKGQRQLIEAVRRLLAEGISVSLDLVGDGDADAAYRALAHEAGVAQAVRFVGYVAREQIAAHYAAAHVFVLPSYNEGMSVATLEAMAAGLPLVVTRTGGTADLVSEEINGLTFDWADVERLTAHLRRLATERGLARRMGMTSRARAERFSWESAAARYAEMFDLIATGARSGRPNTEVVR
jgi:glycosyltransferase involved in cell wall biosynthesis